jgi:hypothetical protein
MNSSIVFFLVLYVIICAGWAIKHYCHFDFYKDGWIDYLRYFTWIELFINVILIGSIPIYLVIILLKHFFKLLGRIFKWFYDVITSPICW